MGELTGADLLKLCSFFEQGVGRHAEAIAFVVGRARPVFAKKRLPGDEGLPQIVHLPADSAEGEKRDGETDAENGDDQVGHVSVFRSAIR